MRRGGDDRISWESEVIVRIAKQQLWLVFFDRLRALELGVWA